MTPQMHAAALLAAALALGVPPPSSPATPEQVRREFELMELKHRREHFVGDQHIGSTEPLWNPSELGGSELDHVPPYDGWETAEPTLTVEAWVRVPETIPDGPQRRLVMLYRSEDDLIRLWLEVVRETRSSFGRAAGTVKAARLLGEGPGVQYAEERIAGDEFGNWHHVALTYSPGEWPAADAEVPAEGELADAQEAKLAEAGFFQRRRLRRLYEKQNAARREQAAETPADSRIYNAKAAAYLNGLGLDWHSDFSRWHARRPKLMLDGEPDSADTLPVFAVGGRVCKGQFAHSTSIWWHFFWECLRGPASAGNREQDTVRPPPADYREASSPEWGACANIGEGVVDGRSSSGVELVGPRVVDYIRPAEALQEAVTAAGWPVTTRPALAAIPENDRELAEAQGEPEPDIGAPTGSGWKIVAGTALFIGLVGGLGWKLLRRGKEV